MTNNLIKNITFGIGLTAIALTGIGCENANSHSHYHKGKRPTRAGMSSATNNAYSERQKAQEEPQEEKLPWPPPYKRAGMSSATSEEYNRRNGIGKHNR